MTSNVFPVSYIEPCFLLSSHKFDLPKSMLLYTLYSFHNKYFNFITISSFSVPRSHQLVFIACYLVLSFLLMYSGIGLSTDCVFVIYDLVDKVYRQCSVLSRIISFRY